MKLKNTIFYLTLISISFVHCLIAQNTHGNSYDEMTKQLQSLASSHPSLHLQSLGQTLGKRNIWLLKCVKNESINKPALLIMGQLEGELVLGSDLCLLMAEAIAKEEKYEGILNNFDIYFIPRPSPDETEKLFHPLTLSELRNTREMDDDRDGTFNEDPGEDLNGDGWLTSMRIKDERGPWMIYPKDPRVMIKADRSKGERGQYRVIDSEGIDNDHDGLFNEDNPGGVRFNRNFTFNYPFFVEGAGPHQISELETRAIADFMFKHKNIFAVYSFSKDDNLNNPWKSDEKDEKNKEKTKLLKRDQLVMDDLVKKYSKILNKKGAPKAMGGQGSFVYWTYFHYGRWSFASRPWWIEGKDQSQEIKNKKDGEDKDTKPYEGRHEDKEKEALAKDQAKRAESALKKLNWFEREKLQGFAPWQKVDHPDFKEHLVEVGGFIPHRDLYPSQSIKKELSEKHLEWIVQIIQAAPKIKIAKVDVETLSEGIYRIEIEVENHGVMPSMSQMGKINRKPNPLQLHLHFSDKVEWKKGYARTLLERLSGMGGHTKKTFLVHTKSSFLQVKVESPTTGEVMQKVPLK